MAEGSFFSRATSSVKSGWRMPLLLIVVAGGAFAVWFFGQASKPIATSVMNGPGIQQQTTQGKEPVSTQYDTQLAKADENRIDDAKQTGKSAMPTVRVVDTTKVDMPPDTKGPGNDDDKLPRPIPPVAEVPPVGLPPIPVAPKPIRIADQQMPENVSAPLRLQMGEINKNTYAPATVQYLKADAPVASTVPGASQAQTPTSANTPSQTIGGIPLPLPGTIIYGEMIGEANSDVPGTVLARVLQGPLAGATMIGSFSAQRDTLVVKFSTMSLGTSADGDDINKSISVNAVAVDSRTISPGVATDVDHHFLVNVGFTAAAAFAQGFGQAIGQSGGTVSSGAYGYQVTNPTTSIKQQLFQAGGTAAGAAGQSLAQTYGNRPVTIKIAAGTPVGILFLPNGNQ